MADRLRVVLHLLARSLTAAVFALGLGVVVGWAVLLMAGVGARPPGLTDIEWMLLPYGAVLWMAVPIAGALWLLWAVVVLAPRLLGPPLLWAVDRLDTWRSHRAGLDALKASDAGQVPRG